MIQSYVPPIRQSVDKVCDGKAEREQRARQVDESLDLSMRFAKGFLVLFEQMRFKAESCDRATIATRFRGESSGFTESFAMLVLRRRQDSESGVTSKDHDRHGGEQDHGNLPRHDE